MKTLRQKLEDLFKSTYYLNDVFKLIYENNENLTKNDLEFISSSICEPFLKRANLLSNDNARFHFIEKAIIDFIDDSNISINSYSRLKAKQEYSLIQSNVVGLFISCQENENSEYVKRKPIQINCDNVVLLALFEEISKEIFLIEKPHYRISQLVSDNFLNKKGEIISKKYCYDEFNEGGGITQKAKNNLIVHLQNIIKRLN